MFPFQTCFRDNVLSFLVMKVFNFEQHLTYYFNIFLLILITLKSVLV